MFTWINKYGPLSEHDAIYVFRQMMCAMEYCHSFNICHRDLKPENILLSEDGEVKIIDFGMAALHQNGQKLQTACGSPHYAAPELLKSKTYRGDKADIWSMGVILFAMLAQRLPFDDPHLPTMLSMSKKGIYTMPEHLSWEAQDLIHCILTTDPDVRISIPDMWEHPLIKRYDDQPGFEHTRRVAIDTAARETDAPIHPRDIDPQVLRQLRALWHSCDVKDIKAKLTSKGPNEQKTFYHLIIDHRDRLLENYDPRLSHSASDYHHLRPKAWATRVATRDFNTHGRTPSRFTVISTIADTDAGGTVRSYDPYHASRNLAPVDPSHARITIHPGKLEPGTARSLASGSVPSRMGTVASRGSRRVNHSLRSRTVSYAQSHRSSMSSIRSSIHGTSSVLVKPRHKRGVDFSSIRRGNAQDARRRSVGPNNITGSASIAGDQTTYDRDNKSPQKKKHENVNPTGSVNDLASMAALAPIIDEDMIRFSYSLAKDCDDAFGSSLIADGSEEEDRNDRSSMTPFSIEFGTPSIQKTPELAYHGRANANSWDTRPLPPTPPTELTPIPLGAVNVKIESPSPYSASAWAAPNINLSVAPLNLPSVNQRRTTSAPVYAHYARDSRPLPSIFENSPSPATGNPRNVSAPNPSMPASLPTPNEDMNLAFLANAESTIRVVESPSARKSTASGLLPEPLNVRKKTPSMIAGTVPDTRKFSQESSKKKYSFHSQLQNLPEEPSVNKKSSSTGSSVGPKKKLSTWFRRASKTSSKGDVTDTTDTSVYTDEKPQDPAPAGPPQRFGSTSTSAAPPDVNGQPAKKKSIMFWKASKSNNRMSIAGMHQHSCLRL